MLAGDGGHPPIDADRMMIVTFTRLASAELRERITNELEERAAKQPNDENLRRQSQSFYKERFGLDIPLEKFNCEGGRSQNVFELCKECPFVKCCKERSVDSCSKCPEYPCKKISDYKVKYVNKCNQI